MKKFPILFFLCLITILASAQKNYEDVIYLKNGGKIRGIIFEQIPFKSLSIYTSNGDTIIFRTDDIESLTREPLFKRRKGYQGMIEMGRSGPAYESQGIACFKISIINSYRFNPYFSIGLGTGLRYNSFKGVAFSHYNEISNDFSLPVYLDTRVNFSVRRLSPFLSVCLGYSFDIRNQIPQGEVNYITATGILFIPAAGVSYIISDRWSANLGIGYDLQKCILTPEIYPHQGHSTFSNGISINFGISF
jgi:hypothetical protein